MFVWHRYVAWAFGVFLLCNPMMVKAQNRCIPPNVLILLDNSNSMKANNKMPDAIAAVKFVVSSYMTTIRFGLMTFCGTTSRGVKMVVKISDTSSSQISASLSSKLCGGTPIKGLFKVVNTYLINDLLPNDPRKDRPTFVLLVTDGKPTDGNPIPGVQALRSLVVGGKTYDVKTFVVGFGKGVDPKRLRNMAIAGGTAKYYQANDKTSLQDALKKIGQAITQELCDDKDNDCDGKIDEDFPQKGKDCFGGQGCKTKGQWICKKDGSGVECNAGGTSGTPEKCNGQDDDCDGKVDEDWPFLGKTCEAMGRDCRVKGQWVCKKDESGIECNAKPRDKEPEKCDGIDNDCDGIIDNGLAKTCQTNCEKGVERCELGKWLACNARKPSAEICDGIDNDCDGQVDEGGNIGCPGGDLCQNGVCVRSCRSGECPSGERCLNGVCVSVPCKPECKKGELCLKGKCQQPGCKPACQPGYFCIVTRCVPGPCKGVTCPNGQYCREGLCYTTCDVALCKSKEKCVEGKCLPNPCAGVTCPVYGICKEGKCVENYCYGITCQKGQYCVRGKCVVDPCNRIQCPTGSKCYEGQCWIGDPTQPRPTEVVDESSTSEEGSTERVSHDAAPIDLLAPEPIIGVDKQVKELEPPQEKTDGEQHDSSPVKPPRNTTGCACSTEGPQGWLTLFVFLCLFFWVKRY